MPEVDLIAQIFLCQISYKVQVLDLILFTNFNLMLIINLNFKGLTPILGSAAASCTRRQSCTEDEDEANTDDQMTEDSHADDLTVPPPPSPPCTCGKNLELPPTPPLDDLEAAAKNLTYSQQGRTIFYCLLPFF